MTKRAKRRSKPPHPDSDTARAKAMGSPATTGRFEYTRVLFWLVPAALALITSVNTLRNGFAADDTKQVLNNAMIRSLENLPLAFTTSVWSFVTADVEMAIDPYYRPLFSVLFSINYALFGTSAWGWHFVNVLVHVLVTVLVYVALKQLTRRSLVSATSAALFAVHPVHVESVAWISGVTDPQLALAVLPAFYYYLKFHESGRRSHLALVPVFYFAGLLCKETAVALPIVVGYVESFHPRNRALSIRLKGLMLWSAVFAVPTAVYVLLRYSALSRVGFGGGARMPLDEALMTTPLALVKYLMLMTVPAGYSYQHFTELVASVSSWSFVGPVLMVGLVVIGVVLSRSRELWFAAVWFIAFLAPALFAIRGFTPEYLVQERYLYIPSLGFCFAVALGVERIAAISHPARAARAVAAVVALALIVIWSVVTIEQNRVWNSDVTLYRNAVLRDPGSPAARTALAMAYFTSGRTLEAETEARLARQLDPGWAFSYLNLSFFEHRAGRLDKAIEHLEDGTSSVDPLRYRYNLATVHLNLGLLYGQRGDYESAEQALLRAFEVWPRATAQFHIGQFYVSRGRYEEALAMFEAAGAQLPRRFALLQLKLGEVYERLGRRAEAREAYQRYLDYAPPGIRDRAEVTLRMSRL